MRRKTDVGGSILLRKRKRFATVLEAVAGRIRIAASVFVLTGSGISAESGLPTFRGVAGLWRTHRVEELASPEGFNARHAFVVEVNPEETALTPSVDVSLRGLAAEIVPALVADS